MENLFNQIRVQFTGAVEKKAGLGGTKDQKIPIQKTQSVKEKKKGGQNWFKKQFSGKTDDDDDSRDMEHAAAVAAAAFAINLHDVSENESKTAEASLKKTKSTKSSTSLLGSASKRLSSSFKLKDDQGGKVPKSSVTDEKKPEEANKPAPSMKKTLTSTDTKPETPRPSPIVPPPPSTKHDPVRQPTPPTDTERQKKADDWERTELENIRQRYDKLREKIDSWESKKKMNARRKLEKEERELLQRELKAWDDFHDKYKYIDQIAVGARTKAEESRKNEELKAKEKANVIRTTGKLPGICFCF